MASGDRSLHFSDQFAISCGTVSLDVERSKVLLVRSRKTGEYLLPKGRKDVGEPLDQAARRETFEETGIRAQLLPVAIDTLATFPSSLAQIDRPRLVTEPIAVSQRVANGILKIIFWYVAAADSATVPEEGTQQEGEDFDTFWAEFDDVLSTLSFDDDQRIAQAAIAAVRRGLPAS
ncbi:uncharacterized protein DNG_01091 [Cephalotrichum gorgonifer]|uniref:Nudix hydrolase domain-containing protein n=1 Tax=Cephalotrichum gorgonifer TaxID=2041049 RepID=A0AAE8MRA0_9PEZI|nr:uncharacterized protein DNG_01091 [Cephalotrichum gorgonifer]